jgi:VanZ family protein
LSHSILFRRRKKTEDEGTNLVLVTKKWRKLIFTLAPLTFVLCGILYISTLTDPPHPDDVSKYLGGIPLTDKHGHLVMFFALGFLSANFLGNFFGLKSMKVVLLCTLLAFLIGVTHEIDQYIVGRGYEIEDVLFDVIGGFFGAVAWSLLVVIKYKRTDEASK